MFNSFLQERQPNSDNIINAKLKLNEFFLTWLSKPETSNYINDLLSGLNNNQKSNITSAPITTEDTITSPSNNNNSSSGSSGNISLSPTHDKVILSSPTLVSANKSPTHGSNVTRSPSSPQHSSSTAKAVVIPIKEDTNISVDSKKDEDVEMGDTEVEEDNISSTDIQTSITTQDVPLSPISLTPSNTLDQPLDDSINNSTSSNDKSPSKMSNSPIKMTIDDSVVTQLPEQPINDIDQSIEKQLNDTSTDSLKLTTPVFNNDSSINSNNSIIEQQPTIASQPPTTTTTTTSPTSTISSKIPKFYFPKVKVSTSHERLNNTIVKINKRFEALPVGNSNEIRTFDEFEILLRDLISVPKILNRLIYINLLQELQSVQENQPILYNISYDKFMNYYKSFILDKEPEEMLFNILKKSDDSKYLSYDDFFLFSKTLIETHPSLEFLKNTPEFQDRYQETIIIRIFYAICRNRGRITLDDLLKSNFLKSLSLLDAEPDINKHLEYFSYEHFYVIYCKFWELDTDHDLLIDANDLLKYGNGSLTYRVVERIIENSIFTKELCDFNDKISYQDFVWFILSEEDKNSETSIEFWFKCIDVDCDGVLSLFEMEYFYEEQKQRLDYLNLDPPVFKDLMCQILDMIKPNHNERITLADLKKSKMSGYLFNVLFNITKFLQQESKESISFDQPAMTDWHNFALHEYEKALAEETSSYQDQNDDEEVDDDEDFQQQYIRNNARYLQSEIDEDDDDEDETSTSSEVNDDEMDIDK